MNKYNKDALLLDHYQQSESQNHNVTLKIQLTVGENGSIVAQFSTQMMLLAQLIMSFNSGARTHLSWNKKKPTYVVFILTGSYVKRMQNDNLISFLTNLGIFYSV